jgi:hypothetical protein
MQIRRTLPFHVLILATLLQLSASLIPSHAMPGIPTYFLTVSPFIMEQGLEE